MKYGVVVCPKCGMAKGVEAEKKTTTCQCGREIDLSRAKLQCLTESPKELARAVADANAALRGGKPVPSEKRPRRKDPYTIISERAKIIKDPLERMQVIASELTALRSEFTLDDLRRVAAIVGKDSAEDMLARLQEHNLVYRVGEETFRAV
ncbi:MAG: hypothetical protein ACUVT7_03290 [Thermoplasmata archaeon]